MPNWVYNHIKIHGNEELKREFIKDFLKNGFKSIIPMPEPLNKYNTETSDHWEFIEKVTEGKIKAHTYDKESKTLLLEKLQKYEPENKEEGRLKHELIECLKTGYYSWYDFALHNWGTKWQPWDIEYIEDKDTLTFVTAWTVPVFFFMTLSKKLDFTIEGESFCFEDPFFVRYRIEEGQITMLDNLTEEFIKELEEKNICFIKTEPESPEKTGGKKKG